MKNNMLVFNDNETHTEIRYVIAHFEKSRWYCDEKECPYTAEKGVTENDRE